MPRYSFFLCIFSLWILTFISTEISLLWPYSFALLFNFVKVYKTVVYTHASLLQAPAVT